MGKVKTLFQENKEKAFDKAELIIMDLIREEWDEYPDEVASRVIDIFKKDHQDMLIIVKNSIMKSRLIKVLMQTGSLWFAFCLIVFILGLMLPHYL